MSRFYPTAELKPGVDPTAVIGKDVNVGAGCVFANFDGTLDGFTHKSQVLADHWVRELDIQTAGVDGPIGQLSGGNQQKAMLARWLATVPAPQAAGAR